jgi:hypothetical protein
MYSRTTNHLKGVTERGNYSGAERGSAVSYYAENACGALTRALANHTVKPGKQFESLADAVRALKMPADRKTCKTCLKAAEDELAALRVAEAKADAKVISANEVEIRDEVNAALVEAELPLEGEDAFAKALADSASESKPFAVRYDHKSDTSCPWQVWDIRNDLLCAVFATEDEADEYIRNVEPGHSQWVAELDRRDAEALDIDDQFVLLGSTLTVYAVTIDDKGKLYYCRDEFNNLRQVHESVASKAKRVVKVEDEAPYSQAAWSEIIANADSRCQAQPIHRQRGVTAVANVEIGNALVKACRQCANYYLAGVLCQYAAAHNIRRIPAATVIDAGPLGFVPCCAECAEFYGHHS